MTSFSTVSIWKSARVVLLTTLSKGILENLIFKVHGMSLSATSYAQLSTMKNAEKDGDLKFGGESEMFGIADNRGKNYNIKNYKKKK